MHLCALLVILDMEFLADLERYFELKKAEWAEYRKTQSMKLIAWIDTSKVPNADDALELFKKTSLSAARSFLRSIAGRRVLTNCPDHATDCPHQEEQQ